MLLKKGKVIKVKELVGLIDSHNTIGILDTANLPAKIMFKIRENIRDVAKVTNARKTLMIRALQQSNKKDKDVMKLEILMKNSPAFIFSNENPFKLFSLIKRNRGNTPAKEGQISPKDIVVTKGPTQIPPGPAITTLGKVGLKTRVEGGKIAVAGDKVVVKTGDVVTADAVAVLTLLKMEPFEIGLEVTGMWEDGTIYGMDVLNVDPEEYVNQIIQCVNTAINFSVNIGYPTKLTIERMIAKAFGEARTLAIEADIIEKDFIDEILAKAAREAKALETLVPQNEEPNEEKPDDKTD
ncbi:MAG: 50S ribosomal protein L10 [Candidatus Aenigmatarchaeota archaeon]